MRTSLLALLVCVSTTLAGPPPGFLMGDANCDGIVNIVDLGIVGTNWDPRVPEGYHAAWDQTYLGWSSGDFNSDGYVNIVDLGIVGTNWQANSLTDLGDEFNGDEMDWDKWDNWIYDGWGESDYSTGGYALAQVTQ